MNNASTDISLIVNKNNDASAIDYSYEANDEDENDDDAEDGTKANKRLKKKKYF